jgi:ligand-binding SRPBCC domain-containing protein
MRTWIGTAAGGTLPAVPPYTTRIELVTTIRASRQVCFDSARSLDLHLRSLAHTGEHIVGGRTSGLIELGEEVTWQARHFGLVHRHTARITAFDAPAHFRDSMVRGRFRVFEHDHFFTDVAGGTEMRDVLEFASPCGWLGRAVDRLVLRGYLTRLLQRRNQVVRAAAEAPTPVGP